MARDPLGERWPEVYAETPEVFARFSDAEDQTSAVPGPLAAAAEFAHHHVLELGSGTGRWTRELAPLARSWTATEPQAGMLAIGAGQVSGRARWLRARAQQMPFQDACYTRIFAAFVLANLRPKTRALVIAESQRLLAPNGELWALENHWEDDFQDLRRASGLEVTREVAPLLESLGFENIDTLETRMEFESDELARDTLGTILGPRVTERLGQHPQRSFLHRVCLLRWRSC